MRESKVVLLPILIFSLTFLLTGCGSTPTNQSPNASFGANPTNGEAPLEVSFDASDSSDPDGNIISYDWDFGDDATGSGQNTTHTYNSSGSYSAKLTVTDDEGSMGTATKTVSVESTNLSPPSWILGEWADESETLTYTFTSDNVTYSSMNISTVDFSDVAENYYVKENSSSSSYKLIVPSEAWPNAQEGQEATLIFDKVSSTQLDYSVKVEAVTTGPFTLYKQ